MKKDSFARELKMEVTVGFFMIVVFVGLAYFTVVLSREAWFGPKYELKVLFKDVMGLREEDNVVARGMPVGKVKKLVLDKEGHGVYVMAKLEHQLRIRKGYKITIVSTSILGGRYMEIKEGPADGDPLPSNHEFHGVQPFDLMADAADVVHSVREGLIDGRIVSNLTSVASQANEIATRLNTGKGTIGKLLSADDKLYNDFSSAVASLKNVAERVDKGEGTLGKLLSKDDTVYRDISAAVTSLKNVTAKVEKGEGALGKIINDEDIYKSVKGAIDEVRATIDDYRETAPVVTFTSIFFGAF